MKPIVVDAPRVQQPSGKTCGIHQPNFLPWLGFWLKWASVDTFVLYDHCPINLRGYTRRVRIAPDAWLTVPLTDQPTGLAIERVSVAEPERTGRRLRQALLGRLGGAPHARGLLSGLASAITTWEREGARSLLTLNLRLIECVRGLMGLDATFRLASALASYRTGPDMLPVLTSAAGANRYVSGAGARAYLDRWPARAPRPTVVDFAAELRRAGVPAEELGLSVVTLIARHGCPAVRDWLARASERVRGAVLLDAD